MHDFVGRSRRAPGEGFAVRRGVWRWALRTACERPDRPVSLGLRGGVRLASRWVVVDGRRLHVRVSCGDAPGPAVVLVHGVVVSSRYLLPTAVELASRFPVLVPDLPGYGLSEAPEEPITLETLADAVIQAAAALGHERVALVGNSFGAQVVVEAAVRHPGRVARIALLGPTVDPSARSLLRQYARWQRCAPDEHLSVVALMARDVVDVGLRRAAHLLRLMLDDVVEEKLPRVACPALVVRGGRDRVTPAAWAQRVADLLPAGELLTVPGYAHMPHYSGPLVLEPALREFLLAASLN